jgi:hypothetical protein
MSCLSMSKSSMCRCDIVGEAKPGQEQHCVEDFGTLRLARRPSSASAGRLALAATRNEGYTMLSSLTRDSRPPAPLCRRRWPVHARNALSATKWGRGGPRATKCPRMPPALAGGRLTFTLACRWLEPTLIDPAPCP